MPFQVLEIAKSGRTLLLYRGFAVIHEKGLEIARVPLDDIVTLLISGYGTMLSSNVLSELADRGIVTIICNNKFLPFAYVLPYGKNSDSAGRIYDQIDLSIPLCKRLWQTVVIQKIQNQAQILTLVGQEKESNSLLNLAYLVKSGDTDNREAVAASRYWPALFGDTFQRNNENLITNTMLNYVYAIIRSAIARAICGTGLIPALGIHHKNRLNPYCLVDDLMEPYRPLGDWLVYSLLKQGINEFNTTVKKKLAEVLWIDLVSLRGQTPLIISAQDTANTLVQSYIQKENVLYFPKIEAPQLDEKNDLFEWIRNHVDDGNV